MIAGCYSLDLYCDNDSPSSVERGEHVYREFPHQYTAEHGSKCRSLARKAGWKLDIKNGLAICPKCVARGIKL